MRVEARVGRWGVSLIALLAVACGDNVSAGGDDTTPGDDAPPGDVPAETVQVVLDDLQPGWHVTTSRLTDQAGPVDDTVISDGSRITLIGAAHDVFVTTVTDGNGQLVASHAMQAPCTMAGSRQLDVPREYPTIQAAIDAAAPGDTVQVAAGTYTESVKLRPGVCLLGKGAKHTILDAGGETRTLVDLTDAPGSVVAGFTMRGVSSISGCASSDPFGCSGDWYRAAVYLGGTSWLAPTDDPPPVITNNIFESNEIAVMVYFHGVSVIRNNVFVGNRSAFVANHFQDRALVANNVFVDNVDLAIGNMAAYLDIINNVIVGSAIGIRFEYIQTGHIRCNLFYGNGANENDTRFMIGTDGNVEDDPQFIDRPGHDFHLGPGSPGKDHGCDAGAAFEPDGSPYDLGAFGGPLANWVDL
jgi:hypothetical protein